MSNICLNLNNYIEISNNNYTLNGNNNVSEYGLYDTSGNIVYSITNIPKKYPLGFYSLSDPDVSNMITYDPSYGTPIKIYVSKGSDMSFNNGNYFRFYDECFNLINISPSSIETALTNSGDNFYFMRNMQYQFIATTDFSSIHPFSISGSTLTNLNSFKLHNINDSFTIIIPEYADNTDISKIFYLDLSHQDVSGDFQILVDSDNVNYYYNDISLSVDPSYGSHYSSQKLSIKSFPFNGSNDISNINFFNYNNNCNYVIQEISEYVNILIQNNRECLNLVSQANLDLSNNGLHFYEFNLNNHGLATTSNLTYYLDYGVYDGSYIIFNIDSRFPITLLNNDVSNAIYIDETYHRTKIIHKSDSRIINLGSPLNTYNYYYNSIKIVIDNSNNVLNDGSFVKINMLDLNSTIVTNYDLSTSLYYTGYCTYPNSVNNTGTGSLTFALYNQKHQLFTTGFSESNNISKLNQTQNYIEPIPTYKAFDKYGHDLSFLIVSNAPTSISDINYELSNILITYTITDYDNNTEILYRLVEISEGPFVEISGNTEIFYQSNTYTNLIELSTNTFESSYNFYENIDVYIFDKSNNKINLPFELTLSGSYYNSNSILYQSSKTNITNSNILTYDNKSNDPIVFGTQKYYLSKNFDFNNFYSSTTDTIDELGLRIFNIENLVINNSSSQILDQENLLHINDDITDSYNEFINNSNETLNKIYLDSNVGFLNIKNIDNSESIIDLSQSYATFSLATTLYITNELFKITMIDTNNSSNNLIIDGSFAPINFYKKNTFIDLSYIGNYELTVTPKGIGTDDYIYNDISNIIYDLSFDYKRTFNINVIDTTSPEINFINNSLTRTYYTYNYPKTENFNVFNDVNFITTGDTYKENSSKPIIEFSDNSIYDGSLSYTIQTSHNIIDFNNDISVTNLSNDASCTILYTAYDLCGNSSEDISLTVIFLNIPFISLIGDITEYPSIYTSYTDDGILIDNASPYILTDTFTDPSSSNGFTPFLTSYEISYNINIDISTIGVYQFVYQVREIGKTDINEIIRFIEVRDISSPFFLFHNLSALPYINATNGYTNDTDYMAAISVDKTPNTIDNSFNIDLSLSVFSHFTDLSYIIGNFDVSDNFFIETSLNTIITLTISNETVPFTTSGLNSKGYLNSDFSLNKVTIGLNKKYPLHFNYKVTDLCDNSFNITRIVDIVDISSPTINYSFNPIQTDYSYVFFDSNLIDFSYQAFNYQKNQTTFLQELNSILFNFDLVDDYDVNDNNFILSISGNFYKQENIKTIDDVSINSDIKSEFSIVNNNIVIKYDFSDNQFNDSSLNRIVDIINTINPAIEFKNIYDSNKIEIDFGNTLYDVSYDFSFSHIRLLNSDINFDMSYILPPDITSISGLTSYDPSALIYGISGDISSVVYDVSFYNIAKYLLTTLSSNIIQVPVKITNTGPSFEDISYTISHEAGYQISDASLLFNVNAISKYDEFHYYNYITDVSYGGTNFDVSLQTGFIQNKPSVGTYTIRYTAIDENGVKEIIIRTLTIVDTEGPIITLGAINTTLNLLEEQLIPNALFEDTGSDLSYIKIDLSNSYNSIIKDISSISIISETSHNFISNDLLLTQNDTSNGNVSYTVTYTGYDIYNNKKSLGRIISITQTSDFVFTNSINIYGNNLLLNSNFNSNFNNLLTLNPNNLASIFDSTSITYNNITKTIEYKASEPEVFNNISFSLSATYLNTNVPTENITIINNIVSNVLGNYQVFFQAFNSSNFDSETQIITFKVIDPDPPILSLITSSDYTDICNISLPVLSTTTFNTLKTNTNFLTNTNLSNPYLFTKDKNSDIIFSIPGVNITDIVSGTTQSLSNETIPVSFDTSFSLIVNYEIVGNPSTDISNGYILHNINNYIQTYKVYDDAGNSSDISRIIIVKRFDPFINLNYDTDSNGNIYKKHYHDQYYFYKDLLGIGYDYFDGQLATNRIVIKTNINENELGIQSVVYDLENNLGVSIGTTNRSVHVVKISCLPYEVPDLSNLITDNDNNKFGLYDGNYTINIANSQDAIRVFGYDYTSNTNLDISNLINISGENVVNYNNKQYHWGKIDVNVINNFYSASIEYLNSNLNSVILEDVFLYSDKCQTYVFSNIFDSITLTSQFEVDVSRNSDVSYQFYTIDGDKKKSLSLSTGKFRFMQSGFKNFYNPIKFSLTEDGTHNGGLEYINNVRKIHLPGLANSYAEILISATTPSPLYYYCEKFPTMGGKIELKNNIIITKNIIAINDRILTSDNSNALTNTYSEDTLQNKIFLSHHFEISNNDIKEIKNFTSITHQNINHNILVNKGKNLILIKSYQEKDISYSDMSNNLKHDISDSYLFDFSTNNNNSSIFQYDYKIDTSANLLQNTSLNVINDYVTVAVGLGTNSIAYSIDNGVSWTGLGTSIFSTFGLGVRYNNSRWVGFGEGTSHTIGYSDNGIDWFGSLNSKNIFSTRGYNAAWNGSKWVAVGKGTNTIAHSSDGINWTGLGSAIFTDTGYNIAWNGTIFVATGKGTNSIAFSSDGLSWTPATNSTNIFTESRGITWSSTTNKWVAVGKGNCTIAHSTDGNNWTPVIDSSNNIFTNEGRSVHTNGTLYVAVGKGTNSIAYSSDGVTWNSLGTTIFNIQGNGITWNGTNWIAVGWGSSNKIATSSDGISWTGVLNSSNIFSTYGLAVEGYSKQTFISDNVNYELDVGKLFYLNYELNNYYTFFTKNKLVNERLYINDFISKINELNYINPVEILNENAVYQFYLNKYLSSNRIVFSHILDNYIQFNLQIYLDLNNLELSSSYLSYLKNNVFNQFTNETIFTQDTNNLLLDEYIVNIFSDICGVIPEIVKENKKQSLIFSNGMLELNEYLLDSTVTGSRDLLYYFYQDISNNEGLDTVDSILENRVFLSLRDNNLDNEKYIGLTQQNLYHNMFIDEDSKFIFHQYNPNIVNYKVNYEKLTLEETIRDSSNNNKYLLEISTNDIYHCYVDTSNIKSIYENSEKKNELMPSGITDYKSIVTYFIDAEINNLNSYLTEFDIRPMSLNDVSYTKYPYTYDTSLQELHSHTYVVDFNDYFDRTLYDSSSIEVPYINLNTNYLSYRIIDISYINDVNLFDIDASQYILHDKNKIQLLNYLQNYNIITNLKLDFLYDIFLKYNMLYDNNIVNYIEANYVIINDLNIQNLNKLYNSVNYISTSYGLTLNNNSLNKLYANNYYNTKIIKEKYLKWEEIYKYHQNITLLTLTNSTYNNIQQFNNVDQLIADISLINFNVDNMVTNLYFFYNEDNINNILKEDEETPIEKYEEFNIFMRLIDQFYKMKENYDDIIRELQLRHINNALNPSVSIIDYSFNTLPDLSNINQYYSKLIDNYVSLNQVLINDITNNVLFIDTGNGTNNVPELGFDLTYNNSDISLTALNNKILHIENNYNYFVNSMNTRYDFLGKVQVFNKINYVMSGSKLLINSFKSNNLLMRLELRYNSYLYQDIYLDTIVFDLAFPDVVQPTITFKEQDISFSQNLTSSNGNNINELMELLINDISYVDINQDFNDITTSNINYNYIDLVDNTEKLIKNNEYSLIIIDVSQVYNANFGENDAETTIDIVYTVKDSANNTNTIIRQATINRALGVPVFYYGVQTIAEYLASNNLIRFTTSIIKGTIITDAFLLQNLSALDTADNNTSLTITLTYNTIIDTDISGTYLNAITYTAKSNVGVNVVTTLNRDIIVVDTQDEIIEVQPDTTIRDIEVAMHSCPAPVYYLPLQHNYKLGSANSSSMRLAKVIMNNIR